MLQSSLKVWPSFPYANRPGLMKGRVSARSGDNAYSRYSEIARERAFKRRIKEREAGSSGDFSPFGKQLVLTFSAGLMSAGCKPRPRPPPPAP